LAQWIEKTESINVMTEFKSGGTDYDADMVDERIIN